MYAVTFALPDESREFRKLLAPAREGDRGGVEVGTLHGVQVGVGHIGVGQAAAEQGISALLRRIRPELLICAGYGGALDPALRVGDLIVDPGTSGIPIAGQNLRVGAIHTASEAAESVEEKRALRAKSGADVVDMETASVAAACAAAGVPMLALRVISDEADQPLPVPMRHWFNLKAQRPRPFALVRYLAAHPGAIAPFARFVRGLSGARARLASGLSEVIAAASAQHSS